MFLAWRAYHRGLEDDRTLFLDEPSPLEASFRALSQQQRPAPKHWADCYLSALAVAGGLRLVTFDQALGAKSLDLILQ
jgi:predicted nucleic acid-binding protein